MVALSFDERVALFGVDVVSYWKFENTGVDAQGAENATITGTPELSVPTIVNSDTIDAGAPADGMCIAWPGTGGDHAEAAHNAAHKTAEGTVVVNFQRDTAIEKSQLIMADSSAAAGGMAIGININGAPDAYIRGVGRTPTTLTGGAGDVPLDRAFTLVFKWGPGGMSLALWNDAGVLARRVTNPATAGLSGTSPIRFGASHTDTSHHDGPYGRVIWLDRRITDVEEVLLAQARTIARSVDRSVGAYRALELGLSPLALWGLGEPEGSTILDAVGTNRGTYSGTIAHRAQDLPDNSTDGAIDFLGTGSGSVPHAAAFSLAEFSLSFWFKANHIPAEDEPALPLITKLATTNTPGDFSCSLLNGDGDVLRIRFRGATPFDIHSPNGAIAANTRYHVCIRGDATGFDAFLNAVFLDKNVGHTTGLSANVQPFQFAAGAVFSAQGNCVLDEVCLFPRVITVPEVVQLAQRSGIAPVAVADAATVPEQATTPIDVLDNDTYVGSPTIEIMSSPGGGDSIAIVPAAGGQPAYINYTAVDVPDDSNRSFSYRVTDPNGTSNTVRCKVFVQASDFVPVSIANCYQISGADVRTVSTMEDLQAEVNAAPPGRQILIADDTYDGGTLSLDPQGTEANPIVIRPASAGRGSVIINDAAWTLADTSARLVITNLFFNNAQIDINGSHHRVARCQFQQIGRYCIRLFTASDTRISHCDFSDYRSTTAIAKGCIQFDGQSMANNVIQRALIDYCHIRDIRQDVDVDPSNPLQIGTAGGSWRRKLGIIVDHCLLDNIGRIGSSEVIVCKTSEVTIRYCTFY